jgi:hypothetical protein
MISLLVCFLSRGQHVLFDLPLQHACQFVVFAYLNSGCFPPFLAAWLLLGTNDQSFQAGHAWLVNICNHGCWSEFA